MITFTRKCSYLNSVYFEVREPGRAPYEAEFRTRLSDYEASIYNGGAERYRAECGPRVNVLSGGCDEISLATVTAFNEWCAAQHADFLALLRSDPARYGPESDWAASITDSAAFKALGGAWYADGAWHFQQAA